jgi:hypothetical protein
MDVLPAMDMGLVIDKACDQKVREYKQETTDKKSIELHSHTLSVLRLVRSWMPPEWKLVLPRGIAGQLLECDGKNECTLVQWKKRAESLKILAN